MVLPFKEVPDIVSTCTKHCKAIKLEGVSVLSNFYGIGLVQGRLLKGLEYSLLGHYHDAHGTLIGVFACMY